MSGVVVNLNGRTAHAVFELAGSAVGDDPAVVQDHDPLGKHICLLQVLGGQEDGGAGGGERIDLIPQRLPAPGVETCGGLIEEDQLGAGDETGGDVQLPPHTSGVGGHPLSGGCSQLKAFQEVIGPVLGIPAGKPEELTHHQHVLHTGECTIHGRVLPGERNQPLQLAALALRVQPEDPNAS